MKRPLLRRGVAVMAAACTLGTSLALVATAVPAHAAGTVLMAGGSDTTQNVMGAILNQANGQYNVKAAVGVGQANAVVTVPSDSNCSNAITYSTDQNVVNTTTNAHSPNGSGAGLDALVSAEAGNYPVAGSGAGCIDIARSSGGPRGLGTGAGKDTASMEYYAFGMDAVSWASPSLQAPATLTLAQLQGIYNCTFTDWSDVGGGAGPIQRYLPQASSGTRKFFISDLLAGADPTTVSTADCPAVIVVQKDHANAPLEENTGTEIDNAGYQQAILPYSAGQWVFQSNNKVNPTVDLRNGVKLGGIVNGANPSVNTAGWDGPDGVWQPNSIGASAPIQEKNIKLNNPAPGFFPGIRYVFNVLDSVSPSYTDAQNVVGFVNAASGAKSSLCSNGFRSTISSFGFAPLTAAVPAGVSASTNLAGATCRKFTN